MADSTWKRYLGDGAFVAFDGYAFVLTAENGIRATDTIVLEREHIADLVRFVEEVTASIKRKKIDE